ncbi:MAG: HNH endonuclease [Phycisphaerales bacterium]
MTVKTVKHWTTNAPGHACTVADAHTPRPAARERPFVYDLHAHRGLFTESEILASLRACAAHLRKPAFTIREYLAWPGRLCTVNPIRIRFGSWGLALRAAGLSPRRLDHPDPADLIANLEEVWRDLGRPPGNFTLEVHGRYSRSAYRRRWGTVQIACARLAAYHRGQISREALLAPIPEHALKPRRGHRLPVDLRWRIIQRDGAACVVCGRAPSTHPGLALQVDHIKPHRRGGTDEESNLRTLCADCNQGRREKPARRSCPSSRSGRGKGSTTLPRARAPPPARIRPPRPAPRRLHPRTSAPPATLPPPTIAHAHAPRRVPARPPAAAAPPPRPPPPPRPHPPPAAALPRGRAAPPRPSRTTPRPSPSSPASG